MSSDYRPRAWRDRSHSNARVILRETLGAESARIGNHVGTAEIDVRSGSVEQGQVQRLLDECDRLRDRVAELERLLNT